MKKRFLLTSILMLLLTVLALSTSTYAWFTMTSDNYVDEFNIVAAESTGGLDISTDGTTWGDKTVTVNTSNTAYDLTSANSGVIYKRNGNDSDIEVASADSYNTFKLYFRTTSYGAIQLQLDSSYIVPKCYKDLVKTSAGAFVTSDTFVANATAKEAALAGNGWNATKGVAWDEATAETGDVKETGLTNYNKSTDGDFTRDWIAAAFRMSFEVTGYQSSTSNTWSASDDISSMKQDMVFVNALNKAYLSKHAVTGKYSVKATGSAQTIKGVQEIDNDATPAITSDSITGNVTSYSVSELLNSGTKTIAAISNQKTGVTGGASQKATDLKWEQGKYSIVEVTVKVWIEGQDNEAILPLTGGEIAAALKFDLSQDGYVDPTDYRTAISFTSFNVNSDGFTWSVLPAAIDGKIYVVEDTEITTTTTGAPTEDAIFDAEKTVTSETKTTLYASTEDHTFYIFAKINYVEGATTGYTFDPATSFKVRKGEGTTASPYYYEYYTFAKVTAKLTTEEPTE